MTFPQRLKAAIKGTREMRRGAHPRSEQDDLHRRAEQPEGQHAGGRGFARMQNVSEDVLRIIGSNRAWMKSYGVVWR